MGIITIANNFFLLTLALQVGLYRLVVLSECCKKKSRIWGIMLKWHILCHSIPYLIFYV